MANIGDTVRVRFDLSKIGGMDAFQRKLRTVNRSESVEKYPIGHAVGVVVGKGVHLSFSWAPGVICHRPVFGRSGRLWDI